MCQQQGRAAAATVVDHIIPHRIGDALASKDAQQISAARARFWDSANWQSLCTTHHNSTKQAQERATPRPALAAEQLDDEAPSDGQG
jgi:5-methylcytosine-specific restriction endonuclease McrA